MSSSSSFGGGGAGTFADFSFEEKYFGVHPAVFTDCVADLAHNVCFDMVDALEEHLIVE
jgi:hypothetical protein